MRFCSSVRRAAVVALGVVSFFAPGTAQAAALPTGYRFIEYVETTAAGKQYLDTAYAPFTATCGMYADIQLTTSSAGDIIAYGTLGPNRNVGSAGVWGYGWKQSGYGGDGNLGSTDQERHVFKQNFYNSGVIIMDDDPDRSASLPTGVTSSTTKSVYVGGGNNGSVYGVCPMRIYRFKISSDATTLACDLRPVKDANGVACFYDTIRGTTHYSKSSAAFVAGPDVIPDDVFEIAATSVAHGEVNPSEGVYCDRTAGQAVTCTSAASFGGGEDGVYTGVCTGWKLYDASDAVVDSGDGTTVTVTHPTPAAYRKLVWQWDVDLKVTAEAAAGGTVEPTAVWVKSGEAAVITAKVANAGTTAFVQWSGDRVTSANKYASVLTIGDVSSPISLTATFGSYGAERTWTGKGADNLASTAANWSGDTVPTALDSIVLDGADDEAQKAITWDLDIPIRDWTQNGYTNVVTFKTVYAESGFHTFCVRGDVALKTGSWTHLATGSTKTYRLNVAVDGDMTIAKDAKIDVSLKGYTSFVTGGGTLVKDQGGSYGSRGSCNTGKIEVWPYGCYYAPEDPGSSGTWSASGGGAVKLTVGGKLIHNGVIDANGGYVTWSNNYTPTGGSIYLIAGEIEGVGTLLSRAYNGTYSGSGGRIAVKLTKTGADFSKYDIVSCANASSRQSSADAIRGCGAPGSIYAETASDEPTHGWYIVRGNGTMPANANRFHFPFTYDQRTLQVAKLTITNNMYVCVDSGCTLDLSKTEVCCKDGNANYRNGIFTQSGGIAPGSTGTILVDENRFAADYDVKTTCGWAPMTTNFVLTGLGRYIINTTPAAFVGSLHLDGANTYVYANKALTVGGDVAITNGTVRIDGAAATPYPLTLAVGGNLTVCEAGKITVAGLGYPAGVGPIAPGGGGASHGGQGLNSSNQPSPSVPYGSVYEPVTAGTGSSYVAGGGILAIVVDGAFKNDGRVTAAGADRNDEFRAAGGTINVRTATLRGKGVFSVDASDSTASTKLSRGAGGRIAVRLTDDKATFDDFAADGGTFRAAGANRQYPKLTPQGGAGTIYLQDASQDENEGTLIVDNGGCTGASQPTVLGGAVQGLLFDKVIVRNGGNLGLAADNVLQVKSGWDCSATFTGGAGSVVDFVGLLPALVSGTTTFANVSCTAAGKKIRFADGAKIAVTENVSIGGTAVAHVVLTNAVVDARWTLDSSAGGAILSNLDLYNCDSASDIVVMGGKGSGNSASVSFVNVTPGETITWTGAKSSAWGDAGNWTTVHDGARVPVASDHVVIPNGCANQPLLTVSSKVTSLSLAANAAITLGAVTLEVTGDASVLGSVSASTGGFLFRGNVTWTGAFERGTSTVVLDGAAQTFTCGVEQFYNLTLLSDTLAVVGDVDCAGALTIGDGQTATGVTFGEGAKVKALALDVPGTSEAPVTLACATAGKKWNLNASKITVSYAAVSGSDASKGVAVVPSDSTDNGNNVNWFFVDTRTHYTGGTLPTLTATTDLVVDEGVTLTFAADAVVKSLTVAPNAKVTVPNTVNLEVKGSVTLENNATLSWNRHGTIGGNLVMLDGSVLTHDTNGYTQTNMLDLSIGGDGYVALGSAVDCQGKGLTGSTRGEYGTGTGDNCGKTHGGRGQTQGTALENSCPSYGSILNPVTIGTRSDWGIGGTAGMGGGAIRLVFAGALTLDGDLNARSGLHTGSHYAPSGGSVNLTCARLSGAGGIWADGGYGTVTVNFPGGGGRVAIRLTDQVTLAPYAGDVTAYGGYCTTDWKTYGSSGTYYLETGADAPGAGLLTIQGKKNAVGTLNALHNLTDVPSTRINPDEPDRAFRNVRVAVRYGGVMNLMRDLSIAGLECTDKGMVKLNGHILSVYSKRPKDWPKKGLPSWVDAGKDASGNPGNVIFPSGLMVIVR